MCIYGKGKVDADDDDDVDENENWGKIYLLFIVYLSTHLTWLNEVKYNLKTEELYVFFCRFLPYVI